MATELEKLLEAALQKALTDSTSASEFLKNSVGGLTQRLDTLQLQVRGLNQQLADLTEQNEAALKREQALMRICGDLAARL